MAVSQNTSGTQSATLSTEHTLATITTPGVYTLQVDAVNHAGGDTTKLRVYLKVRSSSTSRRLFSTTLSGVVAGKYVYSVPVPAVHEVKFTLEQLEGTGRSFDWSVFSLGGTPTQTSDGSQTASIGSTHTLDTTTAASSHMLFVDAAEMVNGDELELYADAKVLTGSTARRADLIQASNVQAQPIKMLGPIASAHSVAFLLKQPTGTGRAYPWSLVSL